MKIYIKSGNIETILNSDNDLTPENAMEIICLGIGKYLNDRNISNEPVELRFAAMLKIGQRGFDVSENDIFLWSVDVIDKLITSSFISDIGLLVKLQYLSEGLLELKQQAFEQMLSRIGSEGMKDFYS